jgi:FtsZ-interacting cell division protein ZipA
MTDLQLALLALGAIIIAAVILFNWLQESRIRRETVRRFEGPVEDALLVEDYKSNPGTAVREKSAEAGENVVITDLFKEDRFEQARLEPKIEPTFSFEQVGAEVTELPPDDITPDDMIEPPMEETEAVVEQADVPIVSDESPEAAEIPAASPEEETTPEAAIVEPVPAAISSLLPPNVDEQIDLVAMIVPEQPCNGEKLREAMLPLPQLDKPSQWMGLTVDGLWRHFTKDQEQTLFSQIVGSLQLADRSGAVSAETLRAFQRKAEETASRLAAPLEWRGPVSPQRYALELDQFCIEVDVMVRLHLIAEQHGQFAGTKLRGLAEAGGMTLQDDGMFHYVNESHETQFTLVNQAAPAFSVEMLRTALIQAVTLQLDVTRVTNCPEAFSKMVLLARRMEQGLNTKLVDDNQRVLGDAEIEKIRQQLKKIHTTMVAHAITPGSPTALRLFS